MSKTRNYQEHLLEKLQDPKKAAAYLNAALDDSVQVFLIAFRNVMEGQGGMSMLVQKN